MTDLPYPRKSEVYHSFRLQLRRWEGARTPGLQSDGGRVKNTFKLAVERQWCHRRRGIRYPRLVLVQVVLPCIIRMHVNDHVHSYLVLRVWFFLL